MSRRTLGRIAPLHGSPPGSGDTSCRTSPKFWATLVAAGRPRLSPQVDRQEPVGALVEQPRVRDRKSTRLNSSHGYISYAVFCLKKKITAISNTGPAI